MLSRIDITSRHNMGKQVCCAERGCKSYGLGMFRSYGLGTGRRWDGVSQLVVGAGVYQGWRVSYTDTVLLLYMECVG